MKYLPFIVFFTFNSLIFNELEAQTVVANEKMNVLYVGLENPLSIVEANVPPNELEVRISSGTIIGSNGNYVANVIKPGDVLIETWHKGKKIGDYLFRVKRIANPIAQINRSRGGCFGGGSFKATSGIVAVIEGLDIDARCSITSFNMTYVAKKQDPITLPNQGGSFNGSVTNCTNRAKPGDIFYFDDIKARCLGDDTDRLLNSLVFSIK